MCDQKKNIAQAFRIFDTSNKGKLKKTDFIAGLEMFTITLSQEDVNELWQALDVKKKNFLLFEDFSKIHQGDNQ
jgi:Ca2+-binding EF-hand superfamily protein